MAKALIKIDWNLQCVATLGVDIRIDEADKIDSDEFYQTTLKPALAMLQSTIDRKRGVPTRVDEVIAKAKDFQND